MRCTLLALLATVSLLSGRTWAADRDITLTAIVTDVLDNGFEGNLSDHVSVGQVISATWTIDAMASGSTVDTEIFNPFDTTIEYSTVFSDATQALAASVGGATAIGADNGSLTRLRYEVYQDAGMGPGPHEVSDYAQLRAQELAITLGGSIDVSGFMTLTQEHTSQSFEGVCPDLGIECLFQGVAGETGAVPWETQRVGFFVDRWGAALADLTSISVAVP